MDEPHEGDSATKSVREASLSTELQYTTLRMRPRAKACHNRETKLHAWRAFNPGGAIVVKFLEDESQYFRKNRNHVTKDSADD